MCEDPVLMDRTVSTHDAPASLDGCRSRIIVLQQHSKFKRRTSANPSSLTSAPGCPRAGFPERGQRQRFMNASLVPTSRPWGRYGATSFHTWSSVTTSAGSSFFTTPGSIS